MAKKWRLEKLEDGNWKFVGTYTEKFIPQMGAAYGRLAAEGLRPYKEIRIVELEDDA